MKKFWILVFFFFLVFGAFVYSKAKSFYTSIYHKSGAPTPRPDKSSYNILLLGYGGEKHEGTWLTDSMMLVHIDLKAKKLLLISLPRDLWVKIPTKSGVDFRTKINAVYQMELFPKNYPDVNNAMMKDKNIGNLVSYVVGGITGLPVDNVVTVDFSGFKKSIDVVDGVDINVLKTFDDYRYPIDGKETELCDTDTEKRFNLIKDYINNPTSDQEKLKQLFKDNKSDDLTKDLETFYKQITEEPEKAFPCRYEQLHFVKGMTHMDGETALKYVRSRYGLQDGSDFGRAARQQQFVEAVRNKVLSIGFIAKINPLLDSLKDHVVIDITPDQMKRFVKEIPSAKSYTIQNFIPSLTNYLKDGRSADGQYVLIPEAGMDNWVDLKTAINNFVLGITPTPTPNPLTPSPRPSPHL